MNSVERLIRSRHLVGALADAPIKGLQIREGLVALDEATGEVRHDRALRQHANDAVRECSARVRDATRLARTECKKGRALLVARGVPLEPHATDDGTGSRNVLARAEVLLERAKAAGVPLTALATRHGELAAAMTARSAARSARHEASAALDAVHAKWDAAYVALRATIEGVLRARGLRSDDLKQVLATYFPPRVARRSEDAAPDAPSTPAPGEEAKPAA